METQPSRIIQEPGQTKDLHTKQPQLPNTKAMSELSPKRLSNNLSQNTIK